MKEVCASREEIGLLELIAKRLYRTYTVEEVERNSENGLIRSSFLESLSRRKIWRIPSNVTQTGVLKVFALIEVVFDAAACSTESNDAKTRLVPSMFSI